MWNRSMGSWFRRSAIWRTLQPDPGTFEAALSERTRFVLINTPNNPTGAVYTEESLRMVTDILRRKQEEYGHPIYLVSDEPYRKLAYDMEVPYLTHFYENTIVVYSYSKALSIPGERIGLYCHGAGGAGYGGSVCRYDCFHAVSGLCQRALSPAAHAAEMCGRLRGYPHL